MNDVWKKLGDMFGSISSYFGSKPARNKTKHSDLDIDLDCNLECVCENPSKVRSYLQDSYVAQLMLHESCNLYYI